MEQFEQAALCFQESTNVKIKYIKNKTGEASAIGNAATSLNLAESFDNQQLLSEILERYPQAAFVTRN